MHVLVPFASDVSEACRHVLADLALPNLTRLLSTFEPAGRDEGDAAAFSPPHERALAAAWGWRGSDGALPFAARAAAADGIDVGRHAWGSFTPTHWQLGRDHVALLDPLELKLDDAESRALFESLRSLLEADGFVAAWGAAGRWYAARADFDGLATASLDRVVGRSVDLWLRHPRADASAPHRGTSVALRRLQSEAQLLFHVHPVNEAREERGDLIVNSFWLSGCGIAQPVDTAATPEVDDRLRAPLLAGDWASWAEAWRALDAGPLARLLDAARAGTPATLTLCGERSAARFEARPRSLWQRLSSAWKKSEPHAVLAAL
jgi:hypothetical protein